MLRSCFADSLIQNFFLEKQSPALLRGTLLL